MPRKPNSSEQRDLEIARKIKPKLQKFLIDQQREGAAKAVEEQKKQAVQIDKDYLIKRASELSCIAFFKAKVWEQQPPIIEMKWLHEVTGTPALVEEMNTDISGFASYLLREYTNHTKLRAYPNPMEEANLGWFWGKMQGDLALLFKIDAQRVLRGNQSVLSPQSDILKGGIR